MVDLSRNTLRVLESDMTSTMDIGRAQAGTAEVELRTGVGIAMPAAARVGFLPVPLEELALGSLAGIAVYLNTAGGKEQFTLYSSARVAFAETHRRRLMGAGVRFVYIAMAD